METINIDLELKAIIYNPRLYLANFFADIRNQIDTECHIYLECQDLNVENKEQAVENQLVMIKEVDTFEKQCLDNLSSYPMDQLELNKDEPEHYQLYERKKSLFLNKTLVFLNKSFLLLASYSSSEKIVQLKFGVLVIVEDEFLVNSDMYKQVLK